MDRDLIYAEPFGVMRLIANLTAPKVKQQKALIRAEKKPSGLSLMLSGLDEMQQAQVGGFIHFSSK